MRYSIPVLIFLILIACRSDNSEPTLEDFSDSLYFPIIGLDYWDTIDIKSIGWKKETILELDQFVEQTNTRALIVLKYGRIAYEKYHGQNLFDNNAFTEDSNWYWASAAKTLTSFLIGSADGQGFLSLDEATSTYLGEGWTTLNLDQEKKITIRNQLSMTTGLDYNVPDSDCTERECLKFLENPDNQWYYHNAPYTLLHNVIERTTLLRVQHYFAQQLASRIGMQGSWEKTGEENIFYSTARSMARFGLLILAEGKWRI